MPLIAQQFSNANTFVFLYLKKWRIIDFAHLMPRNFCGLLFLLKLIYKCMFPKTKMAKYNVPQPEDFPLSGNLVMA